MKARSRRRRKMRLIASKTEERAWAALMAMGGVEQWTSIDSVGDFLKKRQIDAQAVNFAERDPNSRYALRPGLTKHPKGWDDHTVAGALSRCVDKQLVEHQRRDDGNYFRAIKPDNHDMWGLVDDYAPIDPRWRQT